MPWAKSLECPVHYAHCDQMFEKQSQHSSHWCSRSTRLLEESTIVVYTVRLEDCRLVKLRGLMYKAEYSAMIGLKITEPGNCNWAHAKRRVSRPNIALYSALIIKPRNFAKRQCKLQRVIPPKTKCDLDTGASGRSLQSLIERIFFTSKNDRYSRGSVLIGKWKPFILPRAFTSTVRVDY